MEGLVILARQEVLFFLRVAVSPEDGALVGLETVVPEVVGRKDGVDCGQVCRDSFPSFRLQGFETLDQKSLSSIC